MNDAADRQQPDERGVQNMPQTEQSFVSRKLSRLLHCAQILFRVPGNLQIMLLLLLSVPSLRMGKVSDSTTQLTSAVCSQTTPLPAQ